MPLAKNRCCWPSFAAKIASLRIKCSWLLDFTFFASEQFELKCVGYRLELSFLFHCFWQLALMTKLESEFRKSASNWRKFFRVTLHLAFCDPTFHLTCMSSIIHTTTKFWNRLNRTDNFFYLEKLIFLYMISTICSRKVQSLNLNSYSVFIKQTVWNYFSWTLCE